MTADQLRKSILQQAIQGKLVPQDPNDEPASVLLERIREEKARLVKEKKIKKEKNPSIIFRGEDNSHYEKFILTGEVKCIDDEIPFDLPKGWEWCRIKDICQMQAGKNISASEISEEKGLEYQYRCIGGNGLRGYVRTYNTEGHFSIVGRQGALCGCLNIEAGRFYATEHAVVVDTWGIITPLFMYHILTALNLNQYSTATAQPGLSVAKIIEIPFPLPPLAEQQRIEAKIEELMPLIEQYGKAQSELEALNSNIREQLKKSVLQYAIEGKLVPQCKEDGTAEDLLKEIQTEKQRLYAEGKLKKKDLAHSTIFQGEDNKYYEQIGKNITCIDDEIPFEIPFSWQWVRMNNIVNMHTGNSINKDTKDASYTNVEGLPYIATKDVGFDNNIEYSNGVSIPYNIVGDFRVAPPGTILLCIEGGSAGRKIAILNQEVCFGNKLCCLNPYKDITHYIYHYLQSFTFFSIFSENKNGIIGGVSLNGLKNLLLPLPSSAEIKKINNKLSQILRFIEGVATPL